MDSGKKIKVLIVDDSAIVRKILSETLNGLPDIEVVGTAPDPYVARDKIVALQPDVVTLDIEMPRMDGISFLKKLMQHRPMPVVVISSLAQKGCAKALEALECGAVDVLGKPGGPYSVGELRVTLANVVRSAAHARVPGRSTQAAKAQPPPPPISPKVTLGSDTIIAIGASTGGTEAIRVVVEALPESCPPVVIVQHIPALFSRAFADRLCRTSRIHVAEAAGGEKLAPGLAYLAPGDQHMVIRKSAGQYYTEVRGGPRVCYQRPSVDVLFQSVAATGAGAVGVLLTGMGSDGAAGLLEMRKAGAVTIAQDEATCVVYGMPRQAAQIGAAAQILPLDRIAQHIVRSCPAAVSP